ncbi:MAG: PEP-CTERM sorting domain-containing protein [Kiritimatiellales bacterium]
MKKGIWVIVFIYAALAGYVSASIIASESFLTGTFGYKDGIAIANTNNVRNNIQGNTGFSSANFWSIGSAHFKTFTSGLNHTLLQGTASDGKVEALVGTDNLTRAINRQLSSPLTGTEFFMSGLVSANGSTSAILTNSTVAMGLGTSLTSANNSPMLATGFFLGMTRGADDKIYLSAFVNGTTHNLKALESSELGGTHMIILGLELNASGNDTLTAWYAMDGASDITLAGSWSDFDIDLSDLGCFGFASLRDGGTGTGTGVLFDEWRFGSSILDVVSVPEPVTIGMVGIGAILTVFIRRHFSAK